MILRLLAKDYFKHCLHDIGFPFRLHDDDDESDIQLIPT